MDDTDYQTFGDMLSQKRISMGLTLRELAAQLNISPPYLTDIEKNRRRPFEYDRLQKIVKILGLTKSEADCLYDLAGQGRGEASPDLVGFIMDNSNVRRLLRAMRDNDITDNKCEALISKIQTGGMTA